MLRKSLLFGSALSMSLAAAVASADHDDRRRSERDDADYARVVDVDPVVRRVRPGNSATRC